MYTSRVGALFALMACLASGGSRCHVIQSIPPPRASSSLNTIQLSGGKITRFIPLPGLPNDPTARDILEVCPRLPLTSHTARSAYVLINGHLLITALVIGGRAFVTLEAFSRTVFDAQGIGGDVMTGREAFDLGGRTMTPKQDRLFVFTPSSRQYIVFIPGSQWADAGERKVHLSSPVVTNSRKMVDVILLSDLLNVFKLHDAEIGNLHEFRSVKIVYEPGPNFFQQVHL